MKGTIPLGIVPTGGRFLYAEFPLPARQER